MAHSLEKTPISLLAEFCAKQKKAPPQYEAVREETYPTVPIFVICATALGFQTKGSGRTKKEATHAASQNLLGKCKVCEYCADAAIFF